MCATLAANMLGLDSDDDLANERGEDSLKELLNVGCGNLLTELAGPDPVFDLEVPRAEKLDADGWGKFCHVEETVALLVDEYPLLVRLALS